MGGGGVLMYTKNVILVAIQGRAAGYIGCGRGICVKVEMKRKSKVMVVGKWKAGVSWKIGEEIVVEVEVF